MLHHNERQKHLNQLRVIEAAERHANIGFCLACGHEQDGVEPDACNYKCEHCHLRQVYGAEEIILQGLLV